MPTDLVAARRVFLTAVAAAPHQPEVLTAEQCRQLAAHIWSVLDTPAAITRRRRELVAAANHIPERTTA